MHCWSSSKQRPGCGALGHVRRDCPVMPCVVCLSADHKAPQCPKVKSNPLRIKLAFVFYFKGDDRVKFLNKYCEYYFTEPPAPMRIEYLHKRRRTLRDV